MQLFILLYIEAGSYISEDEEQWEFVVLQVVPFLALFHHLTTYLEIGTKSGNDVVHPLSQLTILLDIRRCSIFIAFPKRSE